MDGSATSRKHWFRSNTSPTSATGRQPGTTYIFQASLACLLRCNSSGRVVDAILAAPLVLDMVRFAELAGRRGETGLMTFLASFFETHSGVSEQGFDQQFRMLEKWADRRPTGIGSPPPIGPATATRLL